MENGVMMQYFEWNLPNDGKLWKKLKEDARHLRDIGVTAVWIPPAYKADEQADEGYATYDLYDLGEFNQKGTVRTKYGTKQELQEAIGELHKNGIQVYLDAVMNHKCGADYKERFPVVEVDSGDRTKTTGDTFEVEAYTGYDFKGRNDKYSDFKYHWYHFSGISLPQNPDQVDHIYRIVGEGKSWSEGVDGENGNYDYLLGNDLDLDHPEVIQDLLHWGMWVAEELDLDGVRLDAIKHMKGLFIKQFLETVRASRKGRFFAVGEYWNNDFDALENYLNGVGKELNLFDVPLHFKLHQASQEGRDFDLTNMPDDTLVSRYPMNAVTFVDNHDSQHGSSLESQVKDWFKPLAYGLILLMEKGYPCVFYGDYYGVGGKESPHRLILDILLDARRRYAYGQQDYYFDHPNTVGLVRRGDDEHPGSGLALLLSNGEDGEKEMFVGEERQGEIWHEITGSIDEPVTIGEDGKALFRVQGGKMAVWVKKPDGAAE
ncbi:alpha-amylase [uncultured Rikenella sp.]|uniref:alpha-amylase n=1 Tax=uncultured Rikenella sp. TaxID=368003 RepID=UPI00260BB4AC|nr:alpha-amylase [uncultured Rikenella sp.]